MSRDLVDPTHSLFSCQEDIYDTIKHPKILEETNVDAITNPGDLEFIEIPKTSHRNLHHENNDTQGFSDFYLSYSKLKDDQSPFPRSKILFDSPNVAGFHRDFAFSSAYQPTNLMKTNFSQESMAISSFVNPNKFLEDEFHHHFENSNRSQLQDFNTQSEPADSPMILRWGADMSRLPKRRNLAQHDFLKKNSFIGGSFEDDTNGFTYKDFKEPEKTSQTDINKIVFPKIEPMGEIVQVKPETPKIQRLLRTPNKKRSEDFKVTAKSTPAERLIGYNEDDDDLEVENEQDGENDESSEDPKHRSSRGLRVLSVKVKDIVGEKQNTTYKEVADSLIKEFNLKFKMRKPGEAKDEQNVKRRVYDALNVLIAADILKKNGKAVFCDPSMVNLGPPNKMKLKDKKDKLLHDLHDIKRRNRRKLDKIRELASKCLAIQNLMRINKEQRQIVGEDQPENDTKKDDDLKGKKKGKNNRASKSPNPKGKKKDMEEEIEAVEKAKINKDEVIQFPFIVLVSSSVENQMNLNMGKTQRDLMIESKNTFNIYGDIDMILKMGFHRVSKEFFEENMPPEVQKYLSATYPEGLHR